MLVLEGHELSNIESITLIEDEAETCYLEENITVEGIELIHEHRRMDRILIAPDYSSQEYLLLANLSKDSKMIHNFKVLKLDPHTSTAIGVWGEENYTKDKRKLAKAINFAVQYAKIGGGARAIADSADISIEEAQEIIAKYNETFFEAIQWKRARVSQMFRDRGIVYNIFGRPRKLGSYIKVADTLCDKGESNYMLSIAEKGVISHIIQGSCGDILRSVLVDLYDKYFKYRDPEIDFYSTVHDEITFSVVKDSEKVLKYAKELDELMTFHIPDAPLPIKVSIDIGYRYGQMFCFEFTDESRTELIPKRV